MGRGVWTRDAHWEAGNCFGEEGVMVEGEELDAGMYYHSRLGLLASNNIRIGAYRIRMLSRILESGLCVC